MGVSQTISFTIDKTESFPIVPVADAAIVLVAVVVAVGLLVYHKKHKHGLS
jgi:lipoprotein signal peptidase